MKYICNGCKSTIDIESFEEIVKCGKICEECRLKESEDEELRKELENGAKVSKPCRNCNEMMIGVKPSRVFCSRVCSNKSRQQKYHEDKNV